MNSIFTPTLLAYFAMAGIGSVFIDYFASLLKGVNGALSTPFSGKGVLLLQLMRANKARTNILRFLEEFIINLIPAMIYNYYFVVNS